LARFMRRRFSATPRRSFRRRSARVGTTTPRLQRCQFHVAFDGLIAAGAGDTIATSFNIQALMPWSNLGAAGYDRSMLIRGIVFDLDVILLAHFPGVEIEEPGPVIGARAYSPMCSQFFIDTFDENEAPISALTVDGGPFVTNPPVVAPAFGVSDSAILPTRWVRRKSWLLKVGQDGTGTTDQTWDAGGYTRQKWSGTIRKRISCDSRQALYWGIWGNSAFTEASGLDVLYTCSLNGAYWYQLQR